MSLADLALGMGNGPWEYEKPESIGPNTTSEHLATINVPLIASSGRRYLAKAIYRSLYTPLLEH
jgi:hypothetical protein